MMTILQWLSGPTGYSHSVRLGRKMIGFEVVSYSIISNAQTNNLGLISKYLFIKCHL